MFRRQLYVGLMYCHMQGIRNMEGDHTYDTKHNVEDKTRIHYVVHNVESSECQCLFHFFDSDKIPCALMLLVFTSNFLKEIPLAYIVHRWTKKWEKHLHISSIVF